MSLALFKLAAIVVTGTAGTGGLVGPFAYTEATRSSYQTKWNKKLNIDGPIISCQDSSFKYDLELTVEGQGDSGFTITVFKEEGEVSATFRKEKDSESEWMVEDNWEEWDSKEVILKSKSKEVGGGKHNRLNKTCQLQ